MTTSLTKSYKHCKKLKLIHCLNLTSYKDQKLLQCNIQIKHTKQIGLQNHYVIKELLGSFINSKTSQILKLLSYSKIS